MKIKLIIPMLLLLLCLQNSIVYAETNTGNEKTEFLTLTEGNRYNPVYYQVLEELYPAADNNMARSADLSLEDYVVDALENLQPDIDVSAYGIPIGEAGERYLQILNNHPSLFYVSGSVSYSYNPSTDMVSSYKVKYTDTEENIRVQQADFNREVQQALGWVDDSMNDGEKALAVHDYLILDCEYDYDRLQNDTVPDVSHSAYGALINKIAVCDGYAKAYACVLDELGIPNTMVSSETMNHAWNMVSIDGEWYHVDVTWDDPVPDCIGRVYHNYFLLSDTVIQDSEHEHTGWSGGHAAVSTVYDEEFWTGITTAFCYLNGTWYYGDYFSEIQESGLLKRSGHLLEASESVALTEQETWNGYTGCYMYLDLEPTKKEIYFNLRTAIYKIDETGTIEIDEEGYVPVYKPECPEGRLIFGFTVRGSQLCYALQETPNIEDRQVVSTYTVEELQLPQIEGITAENVEAVYDALAKQIEVKGVLEGDRITYKYEDGVYRVEQPQIKDVGTYQVSYKVEREGYETYMGDAQIVIQKAKPVYTIPTGLQGSSGSLLGQVTLPQGFVWDETDASAKLREEGEVTGHVSYVPEDTQNYESVSGILVNVTVRCPGHDYLENVTEAPTTTQKGQAIYTCTICGDTYTRELDMLKPDDEQTDDTQKPDDGQTGDGKKPDDGQTGDTQKPNDIQAPEKVSGLKVGKTAAKSLQFSWRKVNGAKYRLILYKGKAPISTVYTADNSYTYKKLKAATLYTLKVTSYVESNGTKLYASDVSIETATAPAKAKLVSAKKKGSTKAKLTWKKVTGADGYEVFMRTGKGSYKKVKTITKGKTVTFMKSGLKKGKNYRFRIRAYKKAGKQKSYGSYSNVKPLKVK